MKKVLVLAMAALMLFGFTSFASAEGIEVGVKAGYGVGTGDFGDATDGAFAYGVFGEYGIAEMFAAQVAFTRQVHDIADLPSGVSAEASINALTANGKFYVMPMGIRPYLTAGVGVYFWEVEAAAGGATATEDSTDIGVNGGGGVTFDVTEQVSVGAEVLYHYITGDFEDGYVDVLGTVSFGF